MMNRISNRWAAEGGYRQFLTLAFPLILSTGSWSVQHFVDRMFLSWYSPEAIAAAVPANLLNFSFVCFFMGTAAYVSTFVAQYFGAGRFNRIGPAVWQGIYISLLGGIAILFLIPLAGPLFRLIGHEPVLQRLEVDYFQILCLGAFPVVAGSAVAGFFSGRSKPLPVMWVNFAATIVNVVLNYALIFGNWGFPEMGIRGAGWATVISAVFSFLVFMGMFLARRSRQAYNTLAGWRLESELFSRLMRYGVPSGVEFFMDISAIALFVLLIGRLGTENLAATNIAFNINMIAFMPMIGSGMAISVLVGQYLGGDRPEIAQKSAYSGLHLTLLYMGSLAASYVLVPEVFIAPFAVQADSARYVKIFGITVVLLRFIAVYSIFDALSIIFLSALKGAGDTRFVMFLMGGMAGSVLVLPTFVAVVFVNSGLTSCWVFITAYATFLGIGSLIRFRGGKWKDMRVIEPPTNNGMEIKGDMN